MLPGDAVAGGAMHCCAAGSAAGGVPKPKSGRVANIGGGAVSKRAAFHGDVAGGGEAGDVGTEALPK